MRTYFSHPLLFTLIFVLVGFARPAPVSAGVPFDFDEFTVPTAISTPTGIVAGPDGNIWFCEGDGNKIGRVDPQGNNFQEFPLPNAGSFPEEITVGPDGNLWFTEEDGNRIGRITPQGMITEFDIPTLDSQPEDIVTGPNGNLWFTELDGNKIGRITPQGDITEFPLPNPVSDPTNITVGPDGNLWFTEVGRIGRITPQGVIDEFDIPTAANSAWGITLGPDGNLWFCSDDGNGTAAQIGRITPQGVFTDFPLAPDADPLTIVTGEDGYLYFVEGGINKIGRITVNGVITEYDIPTADSDAFVIAVGPLGNIWFTESGANQLGKLLFPGLLQFSMADYSVNENAGTATISVARIAGNLGQVTVDFATANGTAIAGQDYQSNSGTLTFNDRDSTDQSFTVTILNNGNQDGSRTVNLSLTDPTGDAALGELAQAILTIVDDDGGGGGGCQLTRANKTPFPALGTGFLLMLLGLLGWRLIYSPDSR